jgi:5-methylcytosine-specific restriction endonuclease McrA
MTKDYYATHREERLAYQKARYVKKAAALIAYQRAYRLAHKSQSRRVPKYTAEEARARKQARDRAHSKVYYATHSDAITARQRAYAAAHPEQTKARAQAYRAAHPERARATTKAWAIANAAHVAAMKQEWLRADRRAHPEKYAEKTLRRKALKRMTQVEKIDFKKILHDANGRCGICHQPFDLFGIDFDHIVPLARGGTHTTDNIQATHSHCNRAKGAKVG